MYTGRWTAVARLVFVTCQAIDRIFPLARSSILENPGSPSRGFLFDGRLSIGDGEAGADGQGSELVDRVAAGARQLLLVEELGHVRVPFAGFRPDHRAGIELAAIDAHRAAETAADLERRIR